MLHAALHAALRRSRECFARGVVPRRARVDKSPFGGFRGKKRKSDSHHLCNGRAMRSYTQTSNRRLRLRPAAELPHSILKRGVWDRTKVIHFLLGSVGTSREGACLTAAKDVRGFLGFFLTGGDHEAEQASGSFLAFAPYLTVVHFDHRFGDR